VEIIGKVNGCLRAGLSSFDWTRAPIDQRIPLAQTHAWQLRAAFAGCSLPSNESHKNLQQKRVELAR
jgi:hypothetical protein